MFCTRPSRAWIIGVKPNGNKILSFRKTYKCHPENELSIPCGHCIGCSLNKANGWAVRCYHESLSHENNYFITLTLNPETNTGLLSRTAVQLFLKRFRKEYGANIKFLLRGEYGSKLSRPHYHLLIFGGCISDLTEWDCSRSHPLYRSATVEKMWSDASGHSNGFVTIGHFAFDSALYCALYLFKTSGQEKALQRKVSLNVQRLGQSADRLSNRPERSLYEPEFIIASRRPGLGNSFLREHYRELFNLGQTIVGGRKMSLPRYYLDTIKEMDPDVYNTLKQRRYEDALKKPKKTKSELKELEKHLLDKMNKKANKRKFHYD